ncbi:hypothetical protein K1718_08940 [Roseibium porphyridii]|uniref:HipA-like kinase domain-containing protein n=1 Tax=Roseibium porphyridii TaxID=2866279 RepID=A0ABY8F7I9_9HYPH|nr:HipA family kinase [Roseibium sp. KMA01]WFE91468.1 hypothetical protein K1718_08940 [Roseibium sp. KMA01]
MSQPYLCGLSDEKKYYVKGRSATKKGCICEAVCAELGKSFDLPIPDFAFVDIDDEVTKYDPEAASAMGTGIGFASQLVNSLTEVKISDLNKFNQDLLKKVFLFDTWICNEDRTGTTLGGNPNLFFSAPSDELVVIDHNLAFDKNFNIVSQKELHICREYWFSDPQDVLLRSIFEPQMAAALKKLDGYLNALPEEWIDAEPDFLEFVDKTLKRYDKDEFWEPITWAV